jgi:hypothetical protein
VGRVFLQQDSSIGGHQSGYFVGADGCPSCGGGYRKFIARVFLGLLLLLAALLKAHEWHLRVTEDWLADMFGAAVVIAELLLAVWLLGGWWWDAACVMTLIVFAGFAAFSAFSITRGAKSCGCFGRMTVDPRLTFFIDLVAIGLVLWAQSRLRYSIWRRGVRPLVRSILQIPVIGLSAISVLCLVVVLGLGSFASPSFRDTDALSPEEWVGSRFELLGEIDSDATLDDGQWIVLFYHHDCGKCQSVMNHYVNSRLQLPGYPPILAVELPPYGEVSSRRNSHTTLCQKGRFKNPESIFLETPLSVLLSSGQVRSVSHDVLQFEGNSL